MKTEQRILVLTAFPAEADAILARTTLDDDPVIVMNGRSHYLCTLGGRKVVIAMTGIGMTNSAEATETALVQLSPRAVIFAGVARGFGRTRIGDVAIPARWTADDGVTWLSVDTGMLAAAAALNVELVGARLDRVPSGRF